MGRRGRPPKGEGITIKSRETQVVLGGIFVAIGVSLMLNNSLSGVLPQMLLTYFGQTNYILGAIFITLGLSMIGVKIFLTSNRFISGLTLLLITLLPLLSFWIEPQISSIKAQQGEGGGIIGLSMHNFLAGLVGTTAELGILITFVILSLSVLSGISLAQFGELINSIAVFVSKLFSTIFVAIFERVPKPQIKKQEIPELQIVKKEPAVMMAKADEKELDIEKSLHPKVKEADVTDVELPTLGDDGAPKMTMTFGPDLRNSTTNKEEESDEVKVSDLDKEFSEKYKPRFSLWTPPPLDFLEPPAPDARDEEEGIREASKIIEEKLASFKIQARVVKAFPGPSVVQYALNLAAGTKVSRVKALAKDLGLALAASSDTIRIESIGGTSYVGIEVPRKSGRIVKIRELLSSKEMSRDLRKLPLVVGEDVRGDYVVEDLQSMPHLLVAGATGTGKSAAINSMLTGLIMKYNPDELKFILVDPKMVEMALYNNMPYLLTPVITEMDKVVHALDWAIGEMMARYRLFKEKMVRKLEEFNEVSPYKIPYIVIAIDEMADLMLTKKGEVEQKIVRIAQLARATGIHLILATQRPSVNVITGLIKANIPARIALTVVSGIDSRVIIDQQGAESLIGKGDMLVKTPDATKLRRVQGAFVSTKEVTKVTDYVRSKAVQLCPEQDWYIDGIEDFGTENTASGDSFGAGGDANDPLFRQAVELAVQQGKASASSLQRYLRIGFSRAARIIDQMEHMGIIASGQGSKPRDVLVSSASEVFSPAKESDSEI